MAVQASLHLNWLDVLADMHDLTYYKIGFSCDMACNVPRQQETQNSPYLRPPFCSLEQLEHVL